MSPAEKQFRVLIVRLGAMGDILHALPAITALRAAHPEWFLGWAVEPQWRDLLCAGEPVQRGPRMPVVDAIHVVAAKQWARSPFSVKTLCDIRRARRELHESRYDICIDLQGAVRSAVIGRWARASRLIGEDKPREHAARFLFGERVQTRGVHVIEQAVEVANVVGGESLPSTLPWLPTDPTAETGANAIVQPFVLISPGAGWGAKRWPTERYAAVARRLHEAGYNVVVNTGPGEESITQELVSLSGGTATARQLTITELIAVTRRVSLAIAGDTGPLHLASALGKPVVGIFGPTDPARNGPFWGSFRVLRHPESRRDHARHAAPEAGLLTITPEAVLDAAMDLLKGHEVVQGGWSKIAKRIRVPMGFAFAGLYLWLARPTFAFMALSLILVIPGIWLRAYASGYVKKNMELTVTGPYAFTRNPLYLGSMLIAFGFALASRSIWIAVALTALFAIIYIPVIRSEEAFLRSKFDGFEAYASRVPRLLPRLVPAQTDDGERGSFSAALYRKHREYNALIGAMAIYAALALRIHFSR